MNQYSSLNILINNTGTVINAGQNLIVPRDQVTSVTKYAFFYHQVTLTFYNTIQDSGGGRIQVPVLGSKVTSGLTGNVILQIYPDEDSPYLISSLSGLSPTVNVATDNVRLWAGKCVKINFTGTNVTGASYVNVLIDRM